MVSHRRPTSQLEQIRRSLYLTQRAIGTFQAAERGPVPLTKRLVRRRVTRAAFGALRSKGLW
jgi:hypothetical protein